MKRLTAVNKAVYTRVRLLVTLNQYNSSELVHQEKNRQCNKTVTRSFAVIAAHVTFLIHQGTLLFQSAQRRSRSTSGYGVLYKKIARWEAFRNSV